MLERNQRPGAKILISGGGRCNFTNLEAPPERFISANPHFCKSALSRFTPRDFIAMVERHRIAYHEKTLGQLFCDGSARKSWRCYWTNVRRHESMCARASQITAIVRGDRFRVETSQGNFDAPSAGARDGRPFDSEDWRDRLRYMTARHFGLPLIEPRPGLVPLRLAGRRVGFGAITHRRRHRGGSRMCGPALSREHAIHASRIVGSGDTADLFVLARGSVTHHRPRARPQP